MGRKTFKGAVSIINDRGRIRLRWRYQTDRYSINLQAHTKTNLTNARKLAVQIEQDMLNNQFDFSLSKYKGEQEAPPKVAKTMVSYFEEWVTDYKQMSCDKNSDYYYIRNTIKKWGEFKQEDLLSNLNNEAFGSKTYNSRLSILRAFAAWLVKQTIWSLNPLEDVSSKKIKKSAKEDRKPFNEAEITSILKAFKENTFSPKSSRYTHAHYYPFVYFIFKTGVRNAEAIGLRVSSIDVKKRVVHIKEVLARTVNGTHASARIRKGTKNGKVRMLPLTDDLFDVLNPLLKNKHADDLVFQSFTGTCIDDRMFQRRVFKPILKELKIEERVLYACRHTFGSRCIDSGITPVMTAFLMGNNPETALRNYTHLINLPKDLPKI
jgi:integrase